MFAPAPLKTLLPTAGDLPQTAVPQSGALATVGKLLCFIVNTLCKKRH
jgi:hypothetical protein